MRYLDWDVLLFPSTEEGAHIPVKEFRTQCYVEQQDFASMPLLTTFIPCLTKNTPFQISIHSWAKTGPVLGPSMDGTRPKEVYQIKLVVDGVTVCTDHFPTDTSWPQIISTTTPHGTPERDPVAHRLRFPTFHKSLMFQSHWDASEKFGRIRVELSSGLVDEKSSRFLKSAHMVTFAFQPAPLDVLEKAGVAWPNAQLFMNPLHTNTYPGVSTAGRNVPTAVKHKRNASVNNINLHAGLSGLPVQSPQPLLNPYRHDPIGGFFEDGSRSTSAYSVMPDTSAPLLDKGALAPAYPNPYADADGKVHPLNIRLPSDQISQIIKALGAQPQQQQRTNLDTTMPPPPLPLHAIASKENGVHDQIAPTLNGNVNLPFGPDAVNFIDRRDESRYSDISMHAGCTGFPSCTTEDAEGHIVHNTSINTNGTPAAPATVVRGRKEGSSPTKPRDFFSTILDPTPTVPQTIQTSAMETTSPATKDTGTGLLSSSPADLPGKKRTRSALKALNINDGGSPEKKEAAKPPRKASKSSISSNVSNKEMVSDGQENMVLDA